MKESEMSLELSDKVAIITGGASGMGRESVRRFHAEGAFVVVADISDEAGEAVARELGERVRFEHCDVSKGEEVAALVDACVSHFGKLDIMFNNAGITGDTAHVDFFDDDFADLGRIVSVDLLGVMYGCRHAGKAMAKTGGGSIINTASTAGSLGGIGMLPYRAIKAGVLNFTKNAAVLLGPHNIRVNSISPGAIETPILIPGVSLPPEESSALIRNVMTILSHNQALKRFGQPEDIANAAIFLGSDRSLQITGQDLVVSGGQAIGDSRDWVAEVNAIFQRGLSPAAQG
jgi:NAD(P)-dependent dehydrogenase (short-subunit alcohol dehydrogenase family)